MAVAGNIKTVKLGTADEYELLAKYIQDSSGNAKVWQDIVDMAQAAKLQLKVVDALPTASEETMHYLYLVPETGTISGVYVEYVTIKSGTAAPYTYTWEKIGSTQTDLSDYAKKGTYTSKSNGDHSHTVSGSVTIPTVSKTNKNMSASASGTAIGIKTTADAITGFGTHTTDNVLGEATTFAVSGGAATKTNVAATASGTAVGADGTAEAITSLGTATTADAITGFGEHTTETVITGYTNTPTDVALGEATTFAVTGGVASNTNIAATASGTALETSNDSFVKSYPGETTNLVTGTVTGINGSTAVPSSVSTTAGTAASWSAAVDTNGQLSFSWTANTPTAVTVGDNVTVAKPASSASTFVTGLGATGTGGTVMVGLGTATTAAALTAASVKTQPTIALSTGATAGAGVVSVTTAVSGVSVTANTNDPVTALTGLGTATTATPITALGTPTTAKAITGFGTHSTATALTGVKVTAQPTIALSTGATAGAGVISVATDITTIGVTANKDDVVAPITALGTATTAKAATAIEVTADPSITLNGDAVSGVSYVDSVTVGTETGTVSGTAATAGSHTHDTVIA